MNTVLSTIFNKFFLSLPIILFVIIVFGILFFSKKLSLRNVLLIFAIWYVLLLSEVILFPEFLWWKTQFQWIPFDFLSQIPTALDKNIIYFQIILQILLFVPMGFFIKFFIKNIGVFHLVILSILIVSFTEFMQYVAGILYSAGRVVDIDDVIFGLLGFWLSVWIFTIFQKISLKNKSLI